MYYYKLSNELSPDVTIRLAVPHDGATLRMLCDLDSAAWPEGPVLIAEIDRRPVAALEMTTHRAIADPFQRSLEAVELLRTRARQLQEPPRGDGRGARLRVRRTVGRRLKLWRAAEGA